MAAQSCSDIFLSECDSKSRKSQEDASPDPNVSSEVIFPSSTSQSISSPNHSGSKNLCSSENKNVSNDYQSPSYDSNCDTNLPNGNPVVIVTDDLGISPFENENDKERYGSSPSHSITSQSKSNSPGDSSSIQKNSTASASTSSNLSNGPIVENDAVPLQAPCPPNNGLDKELSDQTASTTKESAPSSQHSVPVDEDDAGPFNQPAYRRHLKNGNLCYETFTIKDSHYYDLTQGRKLAVILNHEDYNHYDHQHIPRRTGTRKVS